MTTFLRVEADVRKLHLYFLQEQLALTARGAYADWHPTPSLRFA